MHCLYRYYIILYFDQMISLKRKMNIMLTFGMTVELFGEHSTSFINNNINFFL